MAKTAAERQKEYRDGQKGSQKQINSWVSADAVDALSRISKFYVLTKREALEKIILEEDIRIKNNS